MPKQVLQVTNFAGGLNAYSDARDIEDNQFVQNWNAVVDKNGIIRVSGMAADAGIKERFYNTYFQKGYGLFQFSTDYSFSILTGDFSMGIKSGTLSVGAGFSVSIATLEATYTGTLNEFSNMQIFISRGTGMGQSRRIASNTAATPTILTLSDNWATQPDATSEYTIYPWKLDGSLWSGSSLNKDVITNGFNPNVMMEAISKSDKDYYIATKKTASDNSSTNLGYIEYIKALTIKPGVNYTLSFDCAAKSKWHNAVSDGDEDASDATTIGDKVPWVQLYSTTVADTKGSIKTHDATATLSGAWEVNGTYYNIPVYKSSGRGKGAIFDIVISTTSGTGDTATFYVKNRGEGYIATEVLTFKDPVDGDETGTITVSAINCAGLSLTRNGWIKKDDQSKYVDEMHNNYIDNGDFADGVPTTSSDGTDTTAWRLTDSSSVLTLSELAGDGYDGDDGTCRMVAAGMTIPGGVPESYIYQDLTLDDLTSYDLNFLYDSSSGIRYAVYNNDKSKYIIDWTSLGTTKTGEDSNANFSYPLDNISSVHPDSKNKSMKYVTFPLDKSTTGSTAGIRILFSPVFGDSTVDLHGVTLYKAHHDLVSMSYNKDAANPFFQNIQFFSRYSFSFKLPINYTEVSTWKLLFNAGQFGYRADNTLGGETDEEAGATQQVYFDNISLVAEESDTITVLTDNRQNSSNPMFYSSNSNSWVNNLVRWNYQNSKPNYDYVNGMLKICDSNFDSGNSQAIVYHDKDRGWRTNYDLVPSPPEVFSRVYDDTELADERFNAIDYLNTKYKDLYYDFQSNDYGQMDRQNWRLNQFGPGEHQGILLAHVHGGEMHDNNEQHIPEADVFVTPGGNSPVALYDMDSVYYRANHENEEGLDKEDGRIQDFAGVAGWAFSLQDDFSNMVEGSRITGDGWTSKTFQLAAHHPHMGENIGMHDLASSNADKVHSIDFNFEWELFGRWGESTGAIDDDDNGPQAPKFYIRWGNSELIPTEMQNRFQGKDSIDINSGGDMKLGWNQIPLSMHQVNKQNKDIYQYYGEDDETLIKYSYDCTEEAVGGEIKVILKFHLKLPFTQLETLTADTNLAVSIDVLEFETNHSYRSLLEKVAEGNGYWRRSIKVSNDAADWSLDGGVYDTTGYYDGSRLVGGTSCWERLRVEKFEVRYTSRSFVDTVLQDLGANQYVLGSKKGVQANFAFSPLSDSSGWAQRVLVLAATSVNRFGEESAFHPGVERIGEDSNGNPNIQFGEAPNISVGMTASQLGDSYIKETKFYMRDSESDIWYLQFYINHKKKRMYSSTSGISSAGRLIPSSNIFEWTLERDNFKNFNEVTSYEAETMVSQEDGERNSNLVADYKTSVVANNRLYAGNVKQNNTVYGDRMLKSPIGKYNILPSSNFIDVAINDGDEITALAYYKDKILQFKKRKVFVINVSGDYEFLEDTFDNVGVLHQASVAKTPYGIVWANKTGCYIYDGQQMTNLIDGKIPSTSEYGTILNNYWLASHSDYYGDCVVGYIQDRDTLLVRWQAGTNPASIAVPEAITYHFPTKSWGFNLRGIAGNTSEAQVGALSNMITNIDGELLYYRFKSGSDYNSIKKWENSPSVTGSIGSASGSSKVFQFSTKDFTFGDIVNRKKLYKVYITYKVGTDGTDSGILVSGAVNGSGDFDDVSISTNSKFTGGGNCYDSSTLNETDAKWKIAELKFATPGDVNNIYSFQLKLSGSTVPADFEINDISIVYKTKRTK